MSPEALWCLAYVAVGGVVFWVLQRIRAAFVLDEEAPMTTLCASCGAEPRYGSSPFGERCLWPVRQAEIEAAAREPMSEVVGLEEWLIDGTGKPFASLHQPQDATSGVSAILGALPDDEVELTIETEPYPRDPSGLLDAGATARPEPPCCARVGSSWCYLPAGHKELCKGPGEREIASGGIDKGRIGRTR